MEIKGHYKAYNMMISYFENEEFIKYLNQFVNLDKEENGYKNEYRNVNVYIGTKDYVVHTPPNYDKVFNLMTYWTSEFN